MKYLGSRKGAVLVIVLGVLAVLALLATTFATIQATEKQVSRNYLDMVRAKLLAQSGVQDARARLKETFPMKYFKTLPTGAAFIPRPWKFWGTDNTETVEPASTDEIENATNPSYAYEDEPVQNPDDGNITPKNVTYDQNISVGLSGVADSGTYGLNGDQYSLRVRDLSGLIYVNDGIDQGNDGSVSQNLRRILNILGDNISETGMGDRVIDRRPAAGYRNPQDLLKALDFDEVLFKKLRQYITVYAWSDPDVALPVPLSQAMLDQYPVEYFRGNPPLLRHMSSLDSAARETVPPGGLLTCPTACTSLPHDHPATRVYGLDTLNTQYIEVVKRAPVNVNAAPREVLAALLTGLKGFYIADRRRNNPRWQGELYLSFKQQSSFSPTGTEGDEYGYLVETMPIVSQGGTGQGQISAYMIADHIVACRNATTFGNIDYGDSNTYWFGGPFKTWRQFNAFIDNLTWMEDDQTNKPLEDDRPLHWDYDPATQDPNGHSGLLASDIQKEWASLALGSVLKANFNPNLHLNELNPDHNRFHIVDKTDLIVNSTEFNFLPTGYFEVESVGRVVRPGTLGGDVFLNAGNKLVAQAKVQATFKLYDIYREGNQKDFYAGTVGAAGGGDGTNNGLSLEVGPEPDNHIFRGNLNRPGSADNEWAGYIQLPTIGSLNHGVGGAIKAKNTVKRTRQFPATPHLNSAFHVHFTLDYDAHHHIVDRREIAGYRLPGDSVDNHADHVQGRKLPYAGPYDPTKGPGYPHRQSRSFRQPSRLGNQDGGTQASRRTVLAPYAPSDLRIDGVYSERHCSPAYYVRNSATAIWNFSTEPVSGMVSFWFKPSYDPERTGKTRTLWAMSRYHEVCGQNVHVWPFEVVFLPTHYVMGESETQSENPSGPRYWHNNMGEFHSSSMYFGSKSWHNPGTVHHQWGRISRSLNHMHHDDEGTRETVMRGHRWTNITMSWDIASANKQGSLFYNGTKDPYTEGPGNAYTLLTMAGHRPRSAMMAEFEHHDGGEFNQMRIGAASVIAQAAKVTSLPGVIGSYRGNHMADFTVDELYVWKAQADGDPRMLWLRGRYHKPDAAGGGGLTGGAGGADGQFTSQALTLSGLGERLLPPASAAPAPTSTGGAIGGPGGTVPGGPATPGVIRILGLTWTWYGEDTADDQWGSPTLGDYNVPAGAFPIGIAPPDLQPNVRVTAILDGSQPPLLTEIPTAAEKYNDGFATVRDPLTNGPAVIQNPTDVKYRVHFTVGGGVGAILLSSPVLEDVTIYYDDGKSHLMSYVFVTKAY